VENATPQNSIRMAPAEDGLASMQKSNDLPSPPPHLPQPTYPTPPHHLPYTSQATYPTPPKPPTLHLPITSPYISQATYPTPPHHLPIHFPSHLPYTSPNRPTLHLSPAKPTYPPPLHTSPNAPTLHPTPRARPRPAGLPTDLPYTPRRPNRRDVGHQHPHVLSP
jgi:hypothetical protein